MTEQESLHQEAGAKPMSESRSGRYASRKGIFALAAMRGGVWKYGGSYQIRGDQRPRMKGEDRGLLQQCRDRSDVSNGNES